MARFVIGGVPIPIANGRRNPETITMPFVLAGSVIIPTSPKNAKPT